MTLFSTFRGEVTPTIAVFKNRGRGLQPKNTTGHLNFKSETRLLVMHRAAVAFSKLSWALKTDLYPIMFFSVLSGHSVFITVQLLRGVCLHDRMSGQDLASLSGLSWPVSQGQCYGATTEYPRKLMTVPHNAHNPVRGLGLMVFFPRMLAIHYDFRCQSS